MMSDLRALESLKVEAMRESFEYESLIGGLIEVIQKETHLTGALTPMVLESQNRELCGVLLLKIDQENCSCTIDSVYIKENRRREKLGTAIVVVGVEDFLGSHDPVSYVDTSKLLPDARRMFSRLGFKPHSGSPTGWRLDPWMWCPRKMVYTRTWFNWP